MVLDIREYTFLNHSIYLLVADQYSLLQNETYTNTHVSFSSNELWLVQEDGDICMLNIIMDAADILRLIHLVQRAKPATKREMTQFHSDEYVDFLSKINPSNMNSFIKEQHKCKGFSCHVDADLHLLRR